MSQMGHGRAGFTTYHERYGCELMVEWHRAPKGPAPTPRLLSRSAGFTLVEVVLGGATLLVAAGAILGAYIGQMTLNEHARNLALAIQDANRVIEHARAANTGATCITPNLIPPVGATIDAWLENTTSPLGGGGKSIPPDPGRNAEERVVVTCQDQKTGAYCNKTSQGGDWPVSPNSNPSYDPIRVTVGVCWRHRNRTIGECIWNAGNFSLGPDTNNNGVIDGPAVLTTLITCRQ